MKQLSPVTIVSIKAAIYISNKIVFAIALIPFLLSCTKNQNIYRNNIDKPQLDGAVDQVVAGKCGYDIDIDQLANEGWSLQFRDEFGANELDLNETKWSYWTTGAYNNELQLYQKQNLKVANGDLQITAVKKRTKVPGETSPSDNTIKNFKFTSGRIESKDTFSPDEFPIRIYARLKLPAGYGLWPAFWTYNDPWPTQGEIDILEAKGQETTQGTYQTNYLYGINSGGPNQVLTAASQPLIQTGVDLTACYHVYMVEWTQNKLTYYFDGNIVETKIDSQAAGDENEFIDRLNDKSHRIVLNLAVGGDFLGRPTAKSIPAGGTMFVDWVRVFVKQ